MVNKKIGIVDWEMRQEFMSQKFTTSWDEIPNVFV